MIAPSDHIKIQLRIGNHQVEDVNLISNRTLVASRTLEGKSVAETLTLLPLLFSLCGTAQHQCGLMAIEQALGIEPSSAQKKVRDILLDVEGIGEHITRIMMDWASHAYVDTKMLKIRECRKRLAEFKSLLYCDDKPILPGGAPIDPQIDPLQRHCIHLIDVCEQDIFGCSLDQFYSLRTREDYRAWLKGNISVAAACLKIWTHNGFFEHEWPMVSTLPEIPNVFLEHRLDDEKADQFIAEPAFDRIGYETGPLSRQKNHPLIKSLRCTAKTRLIAKLLDLAKNLMDLIEKIETIGTDEGSVQSESPLKGLGQIDAVRGQLFHRIWLDPEGQFVKRYRILAPTEWNFHPEGLLKQALIGTKFSDNRKLMEQARLNVLALDPCVACDIESMDMDQRNHA